MCTQNDIYTNCDICSRDIRYGNAILEIERNVEQHDHEEETGLHSVTVIDSDPLVTLCARCGNSLADRKEIWKHLVRTLGLPGPAHDEDAAQQTEAGLPETCGCCGEELQIGKARVSLVRLIGQMDWSNELNDGELSVIDAEDILSFCPSCGNKMSTRRLKQAMQELLDDMGVPERMEFSEIPPGCLCGGLQRVYGVTSKSTPPEMTDEEQERQRYLKKSQLLSRALEKANEMDRESGFSA